MDQTIVSRMSWLVRIEHTVCGIQCVDENRIGLHQKLVFGRHKLCEVRLYSEHCSRVQARLTVLANGVLTFEPSQNPLSRQLQKLNDDKVSNVTKLLNEGDRLTVFEVEHDEKCLVVVSKVNMPNHVHTSFVNSELDDMLRVLEEVPVVAESDEILSGTELEDMLSSLFDQELEEGESEEVPVDAPPSPPVQSEKRTYEFRKRKAQRKRLPRRVKRKPQQNYFQ